MSTTTPPQQRIAGEHSSVYGRTAVGVDLGEKTLVAAVPAESDLEDALLVDGDDVRDVFAALADASGVLDEAPFSTDRARAKVVASVWPQLRPQIEAAATRTVSYAAEFSAPVLALENLAHEPTPLWELSPRTECGTWLIPTLQAAIERHAADVGVRVVYVDPRYSSQACHRCGALGELGKATLQCTNDNCPVERVGRDRSAAASIARRAFVDTNRRGSEA